VGQIDFCLAVLLNLKPPLNALLNSHSGTRNLKEHNAGYLTECIKNGTDRMQSLNDIHLSFVYNVNIIKFSDL
jgi:hypothetical protein